MTVAVSGAVPSAATRKIALWQAQADFLRSTARHPCFLAAWGTGKSLCGILRAVELSRKYKNNLGVIFRREFTDLRDSTCRDYERYTGMRLTRESREVKFSNGSVIMFRHVEELANLQNLNLGWFWIEQAEELDTDNEFMLLKGRLRRDGVPHSGFITANARGHNWVHRLFCLGELPDASLHRAISAENAANLPADTIQDWERLRTLRPALYEQMVLNSCDTAEEANVVIPIASVRAAVNRQLPLGTVHRRVTVCDVAGPSETSDETVIYDLDGPKIQDGWEAGPGRDLMDTVGRVMAHAQANGSRLIVVDRVGMGEGVYSALKQAYDPEGRTGSFPLPRHDFHVEVHGFDGRLAPEGEEERTYANVKAASWFKVAKIFTEGCVSIPNDDILVAQLSGVTFRYLSGRLAVEAKEKLIASLGHSPDRAEALVMGLDGLERVEAGMDRERRAFALRPYRRRLISGSGYRGR